VLFSFLLWPSALLFLSLFPLFSFLPLRWRSQVMESAVENSDEEERYSASYLSSKLLQRKEG